MHRKSLLKILLLFSTSISVFAEEKIIIDGSTGVRPLIVQLSKTFQTENPDTQFKIGVGMKPDKRISALVNKDIDIAMASHGLDMIELSELDMTVFKIAKMAVVFGINQSIPITSLSEEQICSIYQGKIVNWAELGGPDIPLHVFTRPESEVDTEIIRAHITCFKDLKISDRVKVMEKSGQMATILASTIGAIGITTMVRVEQSQAKIKSISINQIKPNFQNIRAGLYNLTRDSFLVIGKNPRLNVNNFIEFIKSDKAYDVIQKNNAIPIF
ncbi:MAG: substrate-binding domain-containing protein [Pseudomonadota bacterium]